MNLSEVRTRGELDDYYAQHELHGHDSRKGHLYNHLYGATPDDDPQFASMKLAKLEDMLLQRNNEVDWWNLVRV